ncbi:zinc ribbon domain-containing protein [Acidithiobacillus thiooxidans]|uniref:zinc ribbon domain-containing protein n=1 Tax=Acidithiobacillus thiooxidans TaxID=930 RepID=UPI002857F692|nr:zinc ribbon domain-containing protein [Acidithiobacillus thiooxidans]MDR7927325.1 zinc ribbon domain-containing protein [Acidithiobacillus thiooxidans]
MQIKTVPQKIGNQLMYCYGVRLSPESEVAVAEQINKARALYNNIIAVMHSIYDEMQAYIMAHAGQEAREIQAQIEVVSAAFNAAKAANDEGEMKRIAQQRRALWKDLAVILKTVRQAHKETLKERFYSRIGNKAACETYQCRAKAVMEGLGSSTASKILDSALKAWQMSMSKGKAPRFARGDLKLRDTLALQFSEAGGYPVEGLFTGKRHDLVIQYPKKGFMPRSYSPFRFRLGAAKENIYAEGTVHLHREIPAETRIAFALLVRKRIGMQYHYELQLLATLPEPIRLEPVVRRKPLVAIHFGWSADPEGRRLAGISDNGNPWEARLLALPPDIEADLQKASELQSKREVYRDEIVARLKESQIMPTESEEAIPELWKTIRNFPMSRISPNRLHHVTRWLQENNRLPDWLYAWEKVDRRMWEQGVTCANRARNRRKNYYQEVALSLVTQYETILLELPDLKEMAFKVDQVTGERNDLARKARRGRAIASLHVLESAIKWSACKYGVAVLKLVGERTATVCSLCGGRQIAAVSGNTQVLHCKDCSNTLDRKCNGAANAWNAAAANLETLVTSYWQKTIEKQGEQAELKRLKNQKMADARKAIKQAAALVEKN